MTKIIDMMQNDLISDKRNLMEIVSICNSYGVKIILQDPLDAKALKTYSEVLEEVRGYFHLDIMNYRNALLQE